MEYGFIRVACVSPDICVADCTANTAEIVSLIHRAQVAHIQILVFPELCITGYTCADLFMQTALKAAALEALEQIAAASAATDVLAVVGLPVSMGDSLYNCAAYVQKGAILGIVPKTFLPNYSEYYERRWFSPAPPSYGRTINLSEHFRDIPFGTDLLIQDRHDDRIKIACEICEDAWVPLSPSTKHVLHGATIIANLSGSNEVVGKADYRRSLVSSLSAKNVCAYLYANAGHGESSTDMVFSGHSLIAQDGAIMAESKLFEACGVFLTADLDMERISQDRLRCGTFKDCGSYYSGDGPDDYRVIKINFGCNEDVLKDGHLLCKISPHPFVPECKTERSRRSHSIVEMQAEGLGKRLRHTRINDVVIGLSGGLDSTLALLVTACAFDKCNIPRSNIHCITMPCFGTTGRTYTNALTLAKATGVSITEINIKESVLQHFKDIGQNPETLDVTYENCQARERTQILMDYANKMHALVIGTGDLSELALGWCTYNGDHMSMYGVNASIPKTLVRHLVQWFAEQSTGAGNRELAATLADILDTPVSPELLPPKQDSIAQKTEDIIGSYELHDFFMYYVLRWGFGPQKIYFLACQAFIPRVPKETIFKWLNVFYNRFFSQQFKRNCMPDGAKVGTVSLSPRGDWRMPSDACLVVWKKELEGIEL